MKVEIRGLSQYYGDKKVVDNVSFTAESGEIVSLLGPNGSGKSTLIKTIADVLPQMPSTIFTDGTDITNIPPVDRAKLIGYVPQYFHYSPYTTVLDTVLIGRRPYMSWSVSAEDLDAVDTSMKAMGVDTLAESYINELSGGQRQRVFIARALAQKPKLYLFDEPTSSLDLRHQIDTVSKMRDIVRNEDSSMIIALHDLNLALNYSDKVLMLSNGQVIDFGTPEDVITPQSVLKVYGVKSDIIENEHGKFILPYE